MHDCDAEDMARVQAGELDRFAGVVARHQSAMFRYAQSRLGDRALAEDAVQETFLAAFKSRHAYQTTQPFRSWLWTILVHECQRVGRKATRFDAGMKLAAARTLASGLASTPGDSLEAAERRQEVFRSLGELPAEQADAVGMRFFGELSFDEIAEVQQCSTPTAKSRVRYGLKKLSEKLRQPQEFRP